MRNFDKSGTSKISWNSFLIKANNKRIHINKIGVFKKFAQN